MKQRWVFAALPVLTLPVLAVSVLAPPAVASALLMLATPAHAEPMRLAQAMEYGGLPPHEIVTIVRSAGLDPIDQPIRRGPNYVLHAIGQDDQEVRVIVSARRGEIIRVVPIVSASRMPPPRGGVTMGPYERMEPYESATPAQRYVAPQGNRYGARSSVPDDDDEDPSYDNAPRPPAAVPGAAPRPGYAPPPPRTGYAEPPPVIRATPSGRGSDISRGNDLPPPSGSRAATAYPPPPRGADLPPPSGSQPQPSGPRAATAYPPRGGDLPPPSDPRAITAREPGRDGLLPPPPERFPQRVAPAVEKAKDAPKPMKRAAATAAPKPAAAPMPKPKPATPASAVAPSAPPATPATPAPEAAKDTAKETAKEITKTPEPAAPAAETKPAAEAKPSVEKPAEGAVPH